MSDFLPSGLKKLIAQGPVAGPEAIDLDIRVLTGLGHINLRGDLSSQRFIDAVTRVIGIAPPMQVNRFVTLAGLQLYWLGPTEWLLMTEDAKTQGLLSELKQVFQGLHATATDLSGSAIVLEIEGRQAADILAKGCTLDLHPAAFNGGDCAQVGMAKANVLLACKAAQYKYTLLVRRTYAEYLLQWLLHSSQDLRVLVSEGSLEMGS
jgi:sarcosine oxidase subunit gamma